MGKNLSKRYVVKNRKRNYRKSFLIKFTISCFILVLLIFVGNIKNEKIQSFKNYIANTLDKSTDFKQTKNDIFNVISGFSDKIYKTVPVNNFKDNNAPMASYDTPVKIAEASNEKVMMRNPVDGVITSKYCMRIHPVTKEEKMHGGIDIAADRGDVVISAAKGVVEKVGEDEFNGKYVVIKHDQGLKTYYAHLSEICVIDNETVDDNTKIGLAGDTGLATGVNLHFEVKLNGERVDPEQYVTFAHKD